MCSAFSRYWAPSVNEGDACLRVLTPHCRQTQKQEARQGHYAGHYQVQSAVGTPGRGGGGAGLRCQGKGTV